MTPVPVQRAIAEGIAHQQSGRLREAEMIYRQILATDPNNADVLHLLGLIALQAVQLDAALELIGRAIQFNPSAAHFQANYAQVLTSLGRFDDAVASARQALKLAPNFPEAWSNLGIALLRKVDLNGAEQAFAKAIELRPQMSEAHNNLGNIFLVRSQNQQAAACFERAISLQLNSAPAHANLAKALNRLGQREQALASFRKALVLNPADHESQNDMGVLLHDLGRQDEAITSYRRAVQLHPDSAAIHSNLAGALMRRGDLDAALAAAGRAVQLDPNLADAHNNLGTVQMRLGEFHAAIDSFQRAIALREDFPLAHLNLGLLLLLKENYARGWEEYTWRLKVPGAFKFAGVAHRPAWTGQEIAGQTIFLHAEQGFGDSIQFARYVPWVAQRGARIILGCQPELRRLFERIEGVQMWITPADPLPPFDWQCALTSLPTVFQTRVESIPTDIPYLKAEPHSAFRIPHSEFLQVGLVWAGRTGPRDDRSRALTLDALAPLAQVAGVHFHSLQKGDASGQAKHPPPGMQLTDWNSQLHDFADSAALIQNLDLLISIDTAAAHLVGAMGKPGLILLPVVPDWRWTEHRDVSPWYPTLRLFRQTVRGDWSDPIARVADALGRFIASK